MEIWEAKAAVEAILVVASRPVRTSKIAEALGVDQQLLDKAILEYQTDIASADRGLQVRHTTLGIRLEAKPNYAETIALAIPELAPKPISPQALETLTIIALKGPVTLSDINAIRGVESIGTVQTLRNRQLIAQVSRYGKSREKYWKTTALFLETFNLKSLSELNSEQKLAETFPSVYDSDSLLSVESVASDELGS